MLHQCPECGALILGGGVKIDDGKAYCRRSCADRGIVRKCAQVIPPDAIRDEALRVRAGACPNCKKPSGPVESRMVYWVVGLINVTWWHDESFLSCRPCHRRRLVSRSIRTFLFGWWSVRGIFMTPVRLVKNVLAWRRPDPDAPSDALLGRIHFDLVLKLAKSPAAATAAGTTNEGARTRELVASK
jgi:hypothetical protein